MESTEELIESLKRFAELHEDGNRMKRIWLEAAAMLRSQKEEIKLGEDTNEEAVKLVDQQTEEIKQLQQDLFNARIDFSDVRKLISLCHENDIHNEKVTTAWELANKCVKKYHRPNHEVGKHLHGGVRIICVCGNIYTSPAEKAFPVRCYFCLKKEAAGA